MKKNILIILLCVVIYSSCIGKTVKKEKITKTDNREKINIAELIIKQDFSELSNVIEAGLADNYVYNGKPLLYYFVSNNLTDLAITLLSRTKDLSYIDAQLDLPLFTTVIYKKNLILEKAFLQKGVDLTYRDSKRGNASYLNMILGLEDNAEKQFIMEIFCSFDYVRKYFQEEDGTLFAIIWRWSDNSPDYIERIYGKDFKVSNDIPVLHWAITNIDALKYFITKGADTKKVFYGQDYWGNSVDYAYYVRSSLERRQVDGTYIDIESIKNMDTIIEFLENH